jgi:hypothetical protein
MIDFACELVAQGWMRWTFKSDENEVTIHASYLSDAPLYFVNSLISICESLSKDSVCIWQDEPGEFRLVFERKEDTLSLRILRLEKNFSKSDNEQAEVLFTCSEKIRKFVRLVLREFEKLRLVHAGEKYKDLWQHDFPTQAISRLRMVYKNDQSLWI